MSDIERTARRLRTRVGLIPVLVGLAMIAGAAMLPAQGELAEAAALRAEVESAYEILPLSEGLLLRPRDPGAQYRAVELRGSEVAIDGTAVSADELRARLGERAEAILWLLSLAPAERATLLSGTAAPEPAPEPAEVAAAAAPAAPAEAVAEEDRQARRRERREFRRTDAQVVVGSSVTIEEDEVADDVLVVGGSLVVLGRVKGDAVAIGGTVDIAGEVTGDVAAIGASVDLEESARVLGSVVSVGGSVDRHPSAVIEGEIEEVPFLPSLRLGGWRGAPKIHGPKIEIDVSPVDTAFRLAWSLFGVAMLALLALLTLLVARNPVERIGDRAAAEPWKAGLIGLLCQILFFPLLIVVVVVLVVSIIGIPFLLLLPFVFVALLLIALLGYTGVALRLGRWSETLFGWKLASPFLAVLLGVAIIHVWSLIGDLLGLGPGPIKFFAVMFAIFGALACYAAWTVGFGATLMSRFGSASGWSGPAEGPPASSPSGPDLGTGAAASETLLPSQSEREPWPLEDLDEPPREEGS